MQNQIIINKKHKKIYGKKILMKSNKRLNKKMFRTLQVLLVFPKNDAICGILHDACNRLEMDTFITQTLPEAIESFQNMTNGGHNLIIVDGRLPQILDPETVARYGMAFLSYC